MNTSENKTEKFITIEEEDFYIIGKYPDIIIDKIPYGWRLYDFCCNIKYSIIATYQILRYGVSNRECWNLSDTFTNFILPRLKHYKKMDRAGFPCELTKEEWEAILDEIIWTFEYMKEPDIYNPIPEHWHYEPETLANYLAREKTPEEKQANKDYIAKANELDERMKKGMKLFADYYHNLFD